MAIPLFEADVEVIRKLGDVPGADNGLTAQQLKESFDQASVLIKAFLNNTLIPHLNQLVDVQALLDGILDSSLTKEDKAANAKATGEAIVTQMQNLSTTLKRYADAKHAFASATLKVENWKDLRQSVVVLGVTATNTVIVGANPESRRDYGDFEIYCSGQGPGILTFQCDSAPDKDITVNIVILN